MDELDIIVAEAARDLGVPGVAVGVDVGGEREIATHGITRLVHGRPVDEVTLFQIGSTAKTFTATAIMVLVEQDVSSSSSRCGPASPSCGYATS